MTMGLVDTLMVGRLGPEAIGAVGIGTSLFMGVVHLRDGTAARPRHARVAGVRGGAARGVPPVARARHDAGLSVALPVTLLLVGLVRLARRVGARSGRAATDGPYLDVVTWSILPLLLYAAFRRYLQGMGIVRPVMIALVTANLLNVLVNWMLIYGKLGAPAMGVRGAAWATVISRIGMAAFLLGVIVYRERGRRPGLFETPRRSIGRGCGASSRSARRRPPGHARSRRVCGRDGARGPAPADALAAHQIAINLAALTFMVPLGVASAGAVRVGHAVGRRDRLARARRLDGAALRRWLHDCAAADVPPVSAGVDRCIHPDPGVLQIGASLLFVAAIFQLFDGVQGVATGVLRGLGDTRTPMLWNLRGHWFVGLPLGYLLCFHSAWASSACGGDSHRPDHLRRRPAVRVASQDQSASARVLTTGSRLLRPQRHQRVHPVARRAGR